MKNNKSVVNLYICHCCHKRIRNGEVFTRYQHKIHCSSCEIDNIASINLADYNAHEILIDGEVHNAFSKPLVEEEFSLEAEIIPFNQSFH